MDKKYKYLLFDLDGTLTNPYEGITKCFQYALLSFGIKEEQSKLTKVIGPPLYDSFCDFYGFDRETSLKAVEKYRERFSDIGWRENSLLDGADRMLADVKAIGKKISLATCKPQLYAEKIIEEFDIAKYFDFVSGADFEGLAHTKVDVINYAIKGMGCPDCCEILMIGDRKDDVIGAKKCGIDCVGVKTGFAEENELEDAGADYIFDTLDDVRLFLISH